MDDADDFSVAANEDHIERNWRVFHPERIYFLDWKDKQHALIGWKLAPVHQANLALLRSAGDLNLKADLAFGGFNGYFRLRPTSYKTY